MRNYGNKTREEPLKKMKQLDKKNEHLSSDSPCLKQKKELDATSIKTEKIRPTQIRLPRKYGS